MLLVIAALVLEVSATDVPFSAGAKFQLAQLVGGQGRARERVVLLGDQQMPDSTASLRATATIAIAFPRRALTR